MGPAAWATIAKHPLLGYGLWRLLERSAGSVTEHRPDLPAGFWRRRRIGFLDLWLQAGVGCVVLVALITGSGRMECPCAASGEAGRTSYVRWCIVTILCTLVYNIGESSLGMIHLVWFLFLLACVGLNEIGRTGPRRVDTANAADDG